MLPLFASRPNATHLPSSCILDFDHAAGSAQSSSLSFDYDLARRHRLQTFTTEVAAATVCFSPGPKYILPICRPDLDRAQHERPSYLHLTANTLVKRCSTTINFPPIRRPDLDPAQPEDSVHSIVSCQSADQTLIPSNGHTSLLEIDRYHRSLQCCSVANLNATTLANAALPPSTFRRSAVQTLIPPA
jgi:hypothetical protein